MSIEIVVTLPRPGSQRLDRHHISIRRMESFDGIDEPYTYEVYFGTHRGVEFKHRYADGWVTCVRKALERLEREGWNV